jgi:hypothetical protein
MCPELYFREVAKLKSQFTISKSLIYSEFQTRSSAIRFPPTEISEKTLSVLFLIFELKFILNILGA